MDYVNLGRTGVKVSRLCLGCMNFGGRTNEEASNEIIGSALDGGINFIDTANVYGHDPANFNVGRFRSEEIVGRALKKRQARSRVILATKAYFPMSSDVNALAWCMQQPGVTSAIFGPRTKQHLSSALAAANVSLTADFNPQRLRMRYPLQHE